MSITALLAIGEEVTDVEEESFFLFSQEIVTGNLGFVDSHATTVDVTIHDHEYIIHQSPTLLSSSRAGGTTGAVLWKITPPFAEWISSPKNPLWTNSVLSAESIVAELGCGISALLPLTLAPSIQHYIATDQEYVRRFFRTNIDENASVNSGSSKQKTGKSKGSGSKKKNASSKTSAASTPSTSNITFTTLDWELDQPNSLKDCIDPGSRQGMDPEDHGFDLLLSCDCIYNEALVSPFVRTCAEICRLRPVYNPSDTDEPARRPTVCIVAQKQRTPDVFETWLRETLREFRVWRVSDEALGDALKGGSGYLVHLMLAREK
ncbi:uncharacterized protein N7503_001050 [Penicillium pulvis]|uniref:uncharacterized protein n=1 Tax=Penicillium pulvis TaxID=1562058 RepID=UPI00254712A2|nr:uncharacterized protein N7503_001050 [Penicillium pulvis]KAJ5814300.1 hypothetical protein N7503_001050 [Penicillium pulvis]